MPVLAEIAGQLAAFEPVRAPDRHARRRSAVALLLREGQEADTEVLMIERSHREGDPWSGHMGFPGGRLDPIDAHSYDAALRETREELGLDIAVQAEYLGRLSDLATHIQTGRSAMLVTPFVFGLTAEPLLQPNHEVADVVWVPLSFLADPENRGAMDWSYQGLPLELPCYHYRDRRIWGLSLGMLDEFMAVAGLARFASPRPPL